ncbi:hypothetical protein HHSLTHF2_06730 [Vreelandella venusta]|uniref:Uncharacterized protein n=1 Tax=Halomonas hydrothermalis TaxID=115561 RepID=A0A6F8U1H4_9GAMM|nr:hypothetical protein [Halomonas hydrothermalis]BCB06783.1 hypothetical protein HHSLTHF2_06730 [Halomonas hydrothermalis]
MIDPADMRALVAALHEQTQAINRLADSNQQVIDYLFSQEAEGLDDGGAPSTYLDPDEE